ncbi:hypothetical protein TNCV_1249561 [Trichonephila clavipes]|nr:hypothetical protein TNCV_1249561 [Trichonephila clavipes]
MTFRHSVIQVALARHHSKRARLRCGVNASVLSRRFRAKRTVRNCYGKEAPASKSILRWFHQIKNKTSCLSKKKNRDRTRVSEEEMEKSFNVVASIVNNPFPTMKKSQNTCNRACSVDGMDRSTAAKISGTVLMRMP